MNPTGKDTEPKYKQILPRLMKHADSLEPGARLPTVRQLMKQYRVSQAAIERCLDELIRRGMVRRERSRGIFVEGYVPKTSVIGVYSNTLATEPTNRLVLEGIRSQAKTAKFHVADFGPLDLETHRKEFFEAINDMGFAGIIADLSTADRVQIEGDPELAAFLREHKLPLVTTSPLPAVEADSVTTNDFVAFRTLGDHLRASCTGPIFFLAHQGLPSLSRFYGLRAGLGRERTLHSELVARSEGGIAARLLGLKDQGWKGSVILGAPFDVPGEIQVLRDLPWAAGTGQELAVTLETNQSLPSGVRAHLLVKPSFALGQAAAALLIRRITRYRGEMMHRIVPVDVRLCGA